MQIPRIRLAALPLVVLAACSDPVHDVFVPPPPPAPRAISAVSTTRIQAKAGVALDSALVVHVTDEAGRGLQYARVVWEVLSGSGDFLDVDGVYRNTAHVRTDAAGLATVRFWPRSFGTTSVSAQAFGLDTPVTFTIIASTVVIGNGFWGIFLGPDGTDEVTVPVGTPIEWLNYWPVAAHIRSVVSPPAGESFDSGALLEGGSFAFVPAVVGTWEYVWYYEEDPDARQLARITTVPATQ